MKTQTDTITHKNRPSERGSVLYMIFLVIVLFAALSFAVAQMIRGGENPNIIADEKVKIYVTQILDYARAVQQATKMVKISNGCADEELSFENEEVTGYAHTPAAADKCKVFHKDGGGMNWMAAPRGVNDGSPWLITGAHPVAHVGASEDVTRCVFETGQARRDCVELVLILPKVTRQICMAINEANKVENTDGEPPIEDGIGPTQPDEKFKGEFLDNADDISGLVGGDPFILSHKPVGCFENDANGNYYFYYTLLAR